MLLQLLSWVIFGGIAGWIVTLVLRTDDDYKVGLNVVLGMVGALFGGFAVWALSSSILTTSLNIPSIITAVMGSVILIALFRGFTRV